MNELRRFVFIGKEKERQKIDAEIKKYKISREMIYLILRNYKLNIE